MTKPKVLISDKMDPNAARIFEDRGCDVDVITGESPEELAARIGEYDGLAIRSSTKVTPAILDAATNGCRLVNGESDGWPGLVLDQYADTWVLKLYTTAWRPWLPRLRRHLTDLGGGRRVVLRLSRNAQTPDTADGWQDG